MRQVVGKACLFLLVLLIGCAEHGRPRTGSRSSEAATAADAVRLELTGFVIQKTGNAMVLAEVSGPKETEVRKLAQVFAVSAQSWPGEWFEFDGVEGAARFVPRKPDLDVNPSVAKPLVGDAVSSAGESRVLCGVELRLAAEWAKPVRIRLRPDARERLERWTQIEVVGTSDTASAFFLTP